MNEHPSYLRLDRHALGHPDPEVLDHLDHCDACRTYVEGLAPAALVPAWARSERRAPRRLWRWPVAGAAVAAAAVAALLVVRAPESAYVGQKGEPSVVAYVKRGDAVRRWTGRPVRPGDALRLAVLAPGYRWIAVFTPSGDGYRSLHQSALAGEGSEQLLPVSFGVDEDGDRERILVVLLPEVPPRTPLSSPFAATGVEDDRRITRLVFEKERR